MSHALDFSRGKAAIAYTGETPWHGLGQKITGNASIETWQKEASLDWNVEKAGVLFVPNGRKVADKNLRGFNNRTVLYRTDTDAPLGVVSNSHFKPVQPAEVLEFYRDLIKDHGYKMETAGALKGGQKVWALANVGKPFTVGKTGRNSDSVGSYLLFATGMDGSTATTIRLTTIRVVCNNTLTAALPPQDARGFRPAKGIDGCIAISHRKRFDAEAIKQELGILPRQIEKFSGVMNELAARHFNDDEARFFFESLLGVDQKPDEAENEKESNKFNDLMLAYKKGPGAELAAAKDTAWGAINAVTYYVDHIVGRGVDTRLNKAWFGANARLKTRAVQQAMLMTKAA